MWSVDNGNPEGIPANSKLSIAETGVEWQEGNSSGEVTKDQIQSVERIRGQMVLNLTNGKSLYLPKNLLLLNEILREYVNDNSLFKDQQRDVNPMHRRYIIKSMLIDGNIHRNMVAEQR